MLNSIDRRTVLKGAASLTLAIPSLASGRVLAASGTQSLSMQIGWLLSAEQTGEIVAKRLGYFEEEGLDFEFQPGGPSIDGVAMVASGSRPVGQATSSPSLMLAASQGIPVKCFAVGLQEHPFAFFSLPRQPIRKPQDMIGRKIGVQATSKILLSALLRKNGIDEKDVEVVVIGSSYAPLATGQVDAVSGWISNVAALQQLGPDLVTLRLWDSGVKLYALPYYATADVLQAKGDLLAKFLRAAGRGWAFTQSNPEQAVEHLVAEIPSSASAVQLETLKILTSLAFNDETKQHGWGSFDKQVWQSQIDLYSELRQFTAGTPSIDDVVTTSVLEHTATDRPKLGRQ